MRAAVLDAEELFGAGRAPEARGRLEELLTVCPSASAVRPEILSDLAVIAVAEADPERAVRLACEALEQQPDHAPAGEVIAHCAAQRRERVLARSRQLQRERISQLAELSTCVRVRGEPILEQPILLLGDGRIAFGEGVQFGWRCSPGFYDRYCYLEATYADTAIEIGEGTFFNNGCTIRAEGPGVSVGARCLFGWEVEIIDSDFHELHPARRRTGDPSTAHVTVGENVFVGAHTIIAKGAFIGDDTVVGAGSLVTGSLPAGVIAAGRPARVIRELDAAPTGAQAPSGPVP